MFFIFDFGLAPFFPVRFFCFLERLISRDLADAGFGSGLASDFGLISPRFEGDKHLMRVYTIPSVFLFILFLSYFVFCVYLEDQ